MITTFNNRNILIIFLAVFILFILGQEELRKIGSQKFFQEGNYYFNGGEYDLKKAEKYYDTALLVYPETSYAHYQKARIYLVTNRIEEAKKEIDKELAIHLENKRSFYVRGLIDGYLKNYPEAENDFRQFIQHAPDEWAGYMDLSWIYIANNKFQEAADISQDGLIKFPENPWLYSNNGLALYKLGNYDEAKNKLLKGKNLAEKVTSDDWRMAYPGNDPSGAEDGIRDLKAAISYNLALTYNKLRDTDNFFAEAQYYQSLFAPNDARRDKIFDALY